MDKLPNSLKEIYPPGDLKRQIDRYKKLETEFLDKFGKSDYSFFSTPGRVELSGNHTDHNNGKVLAASINLDSIAVASQSGNDLITLYSDGYQKPFFVKIDDLKKNENEEGTTISLIRGIAFCMIDMGYQVGGFNACISSEVLPGCGLSSSASIEVLIASIMNKLYNNQKITPEIIALIGQYSENNYFGKPCGLMDQMACSIGGIVSIDFKNPAKAIVEKINFDFANQDHELVLVHTAGNHTDLTSDYASIPAEMKLVAKFFNKNTLRDVPYLDFYDSIRELRKMAGDRAVLRSIHYYSENDRVENQLSALKEKDFTLFLKLLNESGQSSIKWLQNIYTSQNVNEQNLTLALALSEAFISKNGSGGTRVHGGGFAGTILSFILNNKTNEYKKSMEKVFGNNSVKILKIRQNGSICFSD